jgi:uncharacterized delta-60 repeat protein
MTAKPFQALLLCLLCIALPAQATYSLDASFSSDGLQTVAFDLDTFKADQALDIFPVPGGGYFVAGTVSIATQNNVAIGISKLTAAGAPDTGFDGDGKISIETIFTELVDVAMDSQGRLVFVGTIAESPGPGSDIAVMRVLPSGAVDGGFGLFGIVGADAYDQDIPQAIALTPDDHVVVLAQGQNNGDTVWQPNVRVFENDGSSQNGLIIIAPFSTPTPSGAITWSTQRGRAVVAFGGQNLGNCVVRAYEVNVFVNAGTGLISTGQATVGAFPMPGLNPCSDSNEPAIRAITAATNGALFIAGDVLSVSNPGGGNRWGWVMKVTPSDALDSSFDSDGFSFQSAPFPFESLRYNTMALDAAGKVLAGGRIGNTEGTSYGFVVQRLTSTGTADTSFGNSSSTYVSTAFAGSGGGSASRNEGRALRVEGNRILLAGARLWAAPVDFDYAIATWSEPVTSPLIFSNGFE